MIYLSRNYIGIVAEFVCPSITGILWYFVQYDRLFPPCTVETMNDLMNLYIVLSELYTESLNENYIFCVKSMIQVVNKSEEIIKLCCLVFNVHSHTNRPLGQRIVLIEWSLRKDVSCSLGGFFLGETVYRWNVWLARSVSGESGWDLKWDQSCISATEVLPQYCRLKEDQL